MSEELTTIYKFKPLSPITYDDKQALNNFDKELSANYVTASNLNQIKTVVNSLVDNATQLNNYLLNIEGVIKDSQGNIIVTSTSGLTQNKYDIVDYKQSDGVTLVTDSGLYIDLSDFVLKQQIIVNDMEIGDSICNLNDYYTQLKNITIDGRKVNKTSQLNLVSKESIDNYFTTANKVYFDTLTTYIKQNCPSIDDFIDVRNSICSAIIFDNQYIYPVNMGDHIIYIDKIPSTIVENLPEVTQDIYKRLNVIDTSLLSSSSIIYYISTQFIEFVDDLTYISSQVDVHTNNISYITGQIKQLQTNVNNNSNNIQVNKLNIDNCSEKIKTNTNDIVFLSSYIRQSPTIDYSSKTLLAGQQGLIINNKACVYNTSLNYGEYLAMTQIYDLNWLAYNYIQFICTNYMQDNFINFIPSEILSTTKLYAEMEHLYQTYKNHKGSKYISMMIPTIGLNSLKIILTRTSGTPRLKCFKTRPLQYVESSEHGYAYWTDCINTTKNAGQKLYSDTTLTFRRFGSSSDSDLDLLCIYGYNPK